MKLILLQIVFQASYLIGVAVSPITIEVSSLDCFMYSEHNKVNLCAT